MPDNVVVEPVYTCTTCGAAHLDQWDADDCCRLHRCGWCGAEHHDEDAAYYCCRFSCSDCGTEYRDQSEADDCCRYSCPDCGSRHDYYEDAQDCCAVHSGPLPLLPAVAPYWISVPEIAGRPARRCSLEQELTAGGDLVAKLLYQIGASDSDHVLGYHSSHRSRPRTAHVEEDGSLPRGGGEVVFDRFNLSQREDCEWLSSSLTKIRQLRDHQTPRLVGTGFAAGIHVHISAKAEDGTMFGPAAVATLYELWCYAEDMLYSLSASGWNRHRQPNDSYSGYCKPVPKEQGASSRTVWHLMQSDRYYGLNFQRLYGALGNCTCGAARVGDWGSCDCGALDRATIEWRVFNSSTLPRTIHAWLLMAHAMTAYAADHTPTQLPQNPYGTQTAVEKRMVLEHLLLFLPLTDGERAVIREAADRSPGL